jgi:hypothetical protein
MGGEIYAQLFNTLNNKCDNIRIRVDEVSISYNRGKPKDTVDVTDTKKTGTVLPVAMVYGKSGNVPGVYQ